MYYKLNDEIVRFSFVLMMRVYFARMIMSKSRVSSWQKVSPYLKESGNIEVSQLPLRYEADYK